MRTAFVAKKDNSYLVRILNTSFGKTTTVDSFDNLPNAEKKKDFYNETFKNISAWIANRIKQDRLSAEE